MRKRGKILRDTSLGPGLLMIFGGLALLARQYTWAEERLEPIRLRALRGAAEGVETWPRTIASGAGALFVGGAGVFWLVDPDAPAWWPLADHLWLLGGAWTGVTFLVSCAIAFALIVYSFRRFHDKPEARLFLEKEIREADEQDHQTGIDSIR